ncbi:MAG: trypsin-like peptidase domain-containing protein, partial [Acidimicrobiales bacterium]
MSDTSQTPGVGGTYPPTSPYPADLGQESPGWAPTWVAPTTPGVAGGDTSGYGSYDSYPEAGGYGTPPAGGYGDSPTGGYGSPPAGGYGGYPPSSGYGPGAGFPPAGSYSPAGNPPQGWSPAPSGQPDRRRRSAIAMVLVAALVAAVVGVIIGHSLAKPSSPSLASQSSPSTLPSSGSFNFPGSGALGGGSGVFGGGSNGTGGTGYSNGTGGTGSSNGTGSQGSISAAASAIAAKVSPGIVDVNTELSFQNAAAAGTGEVLSASGLVLTNNHVIDQATTISVTIPSTNQTYSATVVGFDKTDDVAVLQLKNASGLKTIPLGDSSTVQVGDSVVALGNAGGVGGPPSVVTGTVQALNQTITASDNDGSNAETLNGMIETDAPIQPGDSGGPLVNTNGQVIGMDTAASSSNRSSGFGSASSATSSFTIPIDKALSIAKQIESGKGSATVHIGLTGFLGVGVTSNGVGNGAEITQVAPNTPAAQAGLVAGDVITAVDGASISTAQDVTTALEPHHPGDKISITWITQTGSSQTASVT